MDGLSEGVPPPGRVPGQLLEAAPILKRRRRWNREGIGKKGSGAEGFRTGGKYRRKGAARGALGAQVPQGAAPPLAAPPGRLGPWWSPSGSLLTFPEAFRVLIFYIIFREFIGHFKYRENLKYKNSRKQELVLGCTELIG